MASYHPRRKYPRSGYDACSMLFILNWGTYNSQQLPLDYEVHYGHGFLKEIKKARSWPIGEMCFFKCININT
ncbi:unnamed protein product [Amaranthus hypochondriacus]